MKRKTEYSLGEVCPRCKGTDIEVFVGWEEDGSGYTCKTCGHRWIIWKGEFCMSHRLSHWIWRLKHRKCGVAKMKIDDKGQEGGPIWTLPIMGILVILIGITLMDSVGKVMILGGIIFIALFVVIAVSIRYMPSGSAPKYIPKDKKKMNKIKQATKKRRKPKDILIAVGICVGFFAVLWIGMFAVLMLRGGLVPIGTPIPTISEWTLDAVKWATISSVVMSALALPTISGYVWFTERRKQ